MRLSVNQSEETRHQHWSIMCLSCLRGPADLELGVSPGSAGGAGDHHVLLLHLLPGAVHHVMVTIARLHGDSDPPLQCQ